LKVTFIYVLVSVPLKLIAALLVAMLLNQKRRGIGIYRTLFYIPSIIGGSVAVAVMWRNLFSRDGAFNALIEAITGIHMDISWVADPSTALGSLILMAIWQFGSPMLIFLAGLKNISSTYYEAARMDGANKVQCFFSITSASVTDYLLQPYYADDQWIYDLHTGTDRHQRWTDESNAVLSAVCISKRI
jgi:multiple sugar transport system permease protein